MAIAAYPLRLPGGIGNPRRVAAGKVQVEDFLLGLDYGYVVEVRPENYWDDYRVTITFHDAEGNDNELTVHKNVPILVSRHDDEGDDIEWDDSEEDEPVCEICGDPTEEKDSHGTLMCEDCQEGED